LAVFCGLPLYEVIKPTEAIQSTETNGSDLNSVRSLVSLLNRWLLTIPTTIKDTSILGVILYLKIYIFTIYVLKDSCCTGNILKHAIRFAVTLSIKDNILTFPGNGDISRVCLQV